MSKLYIELKAIFDDASKAHKEDSSKDFNEISYALLGRFKANNITLNELLSLVISPRLECDQLFDPWSFAKPSITLFNDGAIALDVNFWNDTSLTIHDHNFQGAFKVLHGSLTSIEFEYSEEKALCKSIGLGSLTFSTSQTAIIDDLFEIPKKANRKGHLVRHNSKPTVTIVLRKVWDLSENLNIYFFPGLRFESDINYRNIIIKKFQTFNYIQSNEISSQLLNLDKFEIVSMYIYRKYLNGIHNSDLILHEICLRLKRENDPIDFLNLFATHDKFIGKIFNL